MTSVVDAVVCDAQSVAGLVTVVVVAVFKHATGGVSTRIFTDVVTAPSWPVSSVVDDMVCDAQSVAGLVMVTVVASGGGKKHAADGPW